MKSWDTEGSDGFNYRAFVDNIVAAFKNDPDWAKDTLQYWNKHVVSFFIPA